MLAKNIFTIFLLLITTSKAQNVFTNIFAAKIKEFFKKLPNNQCVTDIYEVVNGIKNKEMWALRMFDSSSKLNSGILNGNFIQYGSFDMCLSIDQSLNSTKIKGKYCLFTIKIQMNFDEFIINDNIKQLLNNLDNLQSPHVNLKNGIVPIFGALCVPDTCSSEDILMMYDSLGLNKHLPNITVDGSYCQTTDDFGYNKWETSVWLGILFFTFIGLLMLFSTIYDLYTTVRNKKQTNKVFLIFSVYTNFKKLIEVKNDSESIPCISGLRTVSMMWIILGHRFLFSGMSTSSNAISILETWIYGPMTAIVFGSTFAVDTFFVISGSLVIYITLMASSKGKKFSFFYYYFHRYIRLTPPIAAVIILYVTFFQHLSYGPLWPLNSNVSKPCYINWWTTILYIQNFWRAKDVCIPQSWYVSIDTQLYALAPMLFIPLQKWPVPTLFVIAILILISSYLGFYTSWINHVSGHPFMGISNFTSLYASTPVRMNSWLIGCIVGYILFKTHGKKFRMSNCKVFIIWLMVLLTMGYSIFQIMFFTNFEMNQIYSSLYYGFPRMFWCICVGWIIWSCIHGYGGIINDFLSCKLFTILGRLTYSMFLLQIAILTLYLGRIQTPGFFSNFNEIHSFWGDFFFITGASVLWCLAFESPVIAFNKLIKT